MNIEPKKEILEKLIYKFNQEKFSLIIKEIKNLQNQYPKSVFLLNLLGAAYNETFNYDKAIDCFNQINNIQKNK